MAHNHIVVSSTLAPASMRNTIRTYTKVMVDPFDIDPDLVSIEDIAHSLSLQCRFNGHTNYMYSVGRHSIYVSQHLALHGASEMDQLAGLMHDASEAYLCDIPSPIKYRPEFEFYLEVEERAMKIIFDKFGIDYPLSDAVLEADKLITQAEANLGRYTFDASQPLVDEREFLKLFLKLSSS